MTWFYRVSHPIMKTKTFGILFRPTNQEVLEAKDDHIEDVSAVCRCIREMERLDTEARLSK